MSDTGLVETETAAAPSARALTLVAELAAIRDVARRVADALSARYMEVLWGLRREGPEGPLGDDGFSALLDRHGINGEQAQRQVAVWEQARQHRKLRELADEAPGQAMLFVERLIRLGGAALPSPDEDPEVARIMTMTPRAMSRAIAPPARRAGRGGNSAGRRGRRRGRNAAADRNRGICAPRGGGMRGEACDTGCAGRELAGAPEIARVGGPDAPACRPAVGRS